MRIPENMIGYYRAKWSYLNQAGLNDKMIHTPNSEWGRIKEGNYFNDHVSSWGAIKPYAAENEKLPNGQEITFSGGALIGP